MARYYRTSSANPMDYMYNLPTEMMGTVLQNEDFQINNIVNTADLIGSSVLKVPHLTQDKDLLEERQKYYQDKTDGITKSILESGPGSWKKYQGTIKEMGRELQQDMTTGNLSKIQSSYNTLQEYQKRYEKALEKGDISRTEYEAILNAQLKNYEGISKSGTGLQLEAMTNSVNLAEEFQKFVKNKKASGELNQTVNIDAIYKTITEKGWEGVMQEPLMRDIINQFLGSPNIQESLAQRSKYGVKGYENIYDDKGNYIFFNQDPETGKITEANNIISRSLFGVSGANSFMKIKNKSDSDYTAKYLQENSHNNAIERMKVQEQMNTNKENRAASNKYWEDYANNLREGNAEEAALGNQIIYALATGKDPEEFVNGLPSIKDLQNLRTDFKADLKIDSNPASKMRANEVLEEGYKHLTGKFKNNPTAINYLNTLISHPGAFAEGDYEALRKNYLKLHSKLKPEEIESGSWRQNYIATGQGSVRKILENVEKEFKEFIETKYEEYNIRNTKVETAPLFNSPQIVQVIKQNPQRYYTLDNEGNAVDLEDVNSMSKVEALGPNRESKIGFYATLNGGEQIPVFVKDDDVNNYNLNTSYLLKGLKPGSPLFDKMLNDKEVELDKILRSGHPVGEQVINNKKIPSGKRNIVTLNSGKYPAIYHQDGSITILSEDGNQTKTFPSLKNLITIESQSYVQ